MVERSAVNGMVISSNLIQSSKFGLSASAVAIFLLKYLQDGVVKGICKDVKVGTNSIRPQCYADGRMLFVTTYPNLLP